MWTNAENRARYDRSHLRYPSDLSDDEWKLVEPLIPPGKRGGDKRTVIMREVVNGLMYILSTGCQGGPCRKTCRRARRCYWIISASGIATARSILTRYRALYEMPRSELAGKPVPPPPSSTAKA